MTQYLMHYAAKAAGGDDFNMYIPGVSPSSIKPLCKIAGRKDVTSNLERVTCTKCKSKAEGSKVPVAQKWFN